MNGTIGGSGETVGPSGSDADPDQTRAERDQTLADANQTAADGDQSAADVDQSAADIDQAAADDDQAAADADQEASDRGLADDGGADDLSREMREHSTDLREQSTELREHSAEVRERSALGRVASANARDEVAQARDLAAVARDAAAATHDRELAERDAIWADGGVTKARVLSRAGAGRGVTAVRLAAIEARARAAAEREQAARDREQAASDRAQAQADREALLERLVIAETDALTGARVRAAGLTDLDREIDRARRTAGLLVVAYVDVVGLKAVNDAHGHAAGDGLLVRAVRAIRCHLRSYDLVVRVGGDEFLCALSGATVQSARERFDAVAAALASDPDPCEINVGFAALTAADTAGDLIQRADAKLLRSRRR